MTIDFEHFTPLLSLTGGVLIGLAALFLMAMNGRVMGISNILGDITRLPLEKNDLPWRLAFVVGTIAGPFLVMIYTGTEIEIRPNAQGFGLMAAGLIVGLGSAIGSGCTSGHGICGLARFSPRSFAAVMTFIATAMITVFIIKVGF
jgi:uncharacterized membrane protein YedE/YeeE